MKHATRTAIVMRYLVDRAAASSCGDLGSDVADWGLDDDFTVLQGYAASRTPAPL
jgi:hypothetical protein